MSSSTTTSALDEWRSILRDPDQPEHDQGTYWGRLVTFSQVTSWTNLLATTQQEDEARDLVRRVRDEAKRFAVVEENAGSSPSSASSSSPPVPESIQAMSPKQYWAARRLSASVFHPDTGERIFMPFRFSSFVPTNVLILVMMLHPSQQGVYAMMFWQWMNQTLNVCVNYANRNASAEMSTTDVAISYCLACGTSMGVAALGKKILARVGPGAPAFLPLFLPYLAVATAGVANVTLMRSPDYLRGVKVRNKETNEEIDTPSRAAGRWAVTQVAISRALTSLPLLTIPPLTMAFLYNRVKFIKARPSWREPLNIAVVVANLHIAVPLSLAVFPQDCTMSVKSLEPEFQSLRSPKTGEPVSEVIFNKGL